MQLCLGVRKFWSSFLFLYVWGCFVQVVSVWARYGALAVRAFFRPCDSQSWFAVFFQLFLLFGVLLSLSDSTGIFYVKGYQL